MADGVGGAIGKITFDENFRNYIVTKNGVVRVDYEEITEDTLEKWCAKLLAFAALYDVSDGVKSAFFKTLIAKLNINTAALLPLFDKELHFLSSRRNVEFNPDYLNLLF